MWWKTFSAVLAAGLVILGIIKADQSADRNAADWDGYAKSFAKSLDYESSRITMPDAGPEHFKSLEGTISVVESMLKNPPGRAKERWELERQLKYAKESLAEVRAKSVAAAKP